jgi:DNA-binding MarR family transcriptional regulator
LDIVAFVQGRFSLATIGLLVNPGISRIDPGYKGKISIVLHNIGKLPITLYPGMQVISLSFAKLDKKVRSYLGKYTLGTYDLILAPYKHEIRMIRVLETKGQQAFLEEKIESLKDIEKQILGVAYEAELGGEGALTSREIAKRINKNRHYISGRISKLVENAALFALRRPVRGRAFTYKLTQIGRSLAQTILSKDE